MLNKKNIIFKWHKMCSYTIILVYLINIASITSTLNVLVPDDVTEEKIGHYPSFTSEKAIEELETSSGCVHGTTSSNNLSQSNGNDQPISGRTRTIWPKFQQVGEIQPVEDYVDQTSDVDSSADKGSHSSFANEQAKDGSYDTLTEILSGASYMLDLEVQWINIPNANSSELCIYTGTAGAEDIIVDVWNGTGWETVFSELATDSWNNASITDYLDTDSFTIRYRDGSPDSDGSGDSWQIDAALIRLEVFLVEDYVDRASNVDSSADTGNHHSFSDLQATDSTYDNLTEEGGSNYQLDLEVQFTGVYSSEYITEELCIKTGSFSGSESVNITYWDGNSWELITPALTPSAWNNYTISITSPTYTIKFGGSTTSSDTIQDWWEIDSVLIKVEGPEKIIGEYSGFIWLDSPDEVDLGTTYGSWILNQDLSDDSVPRTATGVILAWVENSTNQGNAVARGSLDTNDYMNDNSIYCEIDAETWKMQVVKLKHHRFIDTWRSSQNEKLYVMGYTLGEDPAFRYVPADLGDLIADSTWHTVTVSGVDESTSGVILFAQSTSSVDATVLVRAVGSTDSMTSREWEEYNSGSLFVKLDGNDQFEYCITSGQSARFYLIAEVNDSIDWLDANVDDISATSLGWTTRNLDNYVSMPLNASGVILQHTSPTILEIGLKGRNIARKSGQSWTFPKYDVGGDQWLMGGTGIDSEHRIEIYAETFQQDVYVHAITKHFRIDMAPPVVNSFGVADPGTGIGTFWSNITDDSSVSSVTLRINSTYYSMSNNGTQWIYNFPAIYQGYYEYQIWNATDSNGYTGSLLTGIQDHTFNYDTVAPTVLTAVYDETVKSPNGTFYTNVTDTWGSGTIDTVMVNVTEVSGSPTGYTALMKITASGYINDTIILGTRGIIRYVIFANDTEGNNQTSDEYLGFYSNEGGNTLPVASSPVLSPQLVLSNGTLKLSYTFSDTDGDSELGTEISWYLNASNDGDPAFYWQPGLNMTITFLNHSDITLLSDYLNKNDQWYAVIRPSDNNGVDYGTTVSSCAITVRNTPPKFTSVFVTPSAPTTVSTLDATPVLQNYYDTDSDPRISYTIEWYKNGQPTGETGLTVDSSLTTKGEKWSFIITASDGENESIWYTADNVTILNSVPTASDYRILNAGMLKTPDNLLANWTFYDADSGDREASYELYWYKNGVQQPGLDNNLAVGAGNTTKGETWFFKLRVSDGENESILYSLEFMPVTILNSQMVINWVEINNNDAIARVNDSLTVDLDWYDPDGDFTVRDYIIYWYLDGTYRNDLTNETTVPSTELVKHQQWYCIYRVADDEKLWSENKSSQLITIINSQMVINWVEINNNDTIAYVTEDLNVDLDWTDSDGDTNYTGFIIYWYVDNTYRADLTNNTVISSSELAKHQQWYCIYRVADDEMLWSENKSSQKIEILNSKPAIPVVTVIYGHDETIVVSTDHDVSARSFLLEDEDVAFVYTFTDDDGDTNQSVIYWFKDNILQELYTNQTVLPSSATKRGDTWRFEIHPHDGEEYGEIISSINFEIRSRPVINTCGIEPQVEEEGFYHLWANITDEQNEIDRVFYNATVNELSYWWNVTVRETNGTAGIYICDNFKLLSILKQFSGISFNDIAGSNVSVIITVQIRVGLYEVRSFSTFNYTIVDEASPRVIDANYFWYDERKPSNITFYALIEEYGSGIDLVVLFYCFRTATTSNSKPALLWRSKHSQDDADFSSIIMEYNGTHYIAVLDFAPTENTEILFRIQVSDQVGNINSDAYPLGTDLDFINRNKFTYLASISLEQLIPFIAGFVAIIAVISFVAIRKFSGIELVGLDIDKVMEGITRISPDDITATLDIHTLGIIISFFDQRHGPIPIILEPEMLNDNYNLMLELSDKSFSAGHFVGNYDHEVLSNFEFSPERSEISTTSLTWSFALERPEARAGSENITLNLLVHKEYVSFILQFVNQFKEIVHRIHILMDKSLTEKEEIVTKIQEFRRFVTSIILSYEQLYGSIDDWKEQEEN